jgi:hypothetical protein
MIKPQEVLARHKTIKPFEASIDSTLRAPWNEEMQRRGRRVSLLISHGEADEHGTHRSPSQVQRALLRRKYKDAGWVIKDDPESKDAWVFMFPKDLTDPKGAE